MQFESHFAFTSRAVPFKGNLTCSLTSGRFHEQPGKSSCSFPCLKTLIFVLGFFCTYSTSTETKGNRKRKKMLLLYVCMYVCT